VASSSKQKEHAYFWAAGASLNIEMQQSLYGPGFAGCMLILKPVPLAVPPSLLR